MDTTLIPEDHPVTLTWNSTTVEEHTLTLTYAELRAEIDHLRDREGLPWHPDLARDLYLLEETWLGDHEDDGALAEFERTVTGHDLPPLPELPTFTVTVAGSERHDGEAGYTYALHAPDLERAKRLVLKHHIAENEEDIGIDGEACDPDVIVVEGPWDTFDGAPAWPADLPGRAWTDLRAERGLLERAYRMGKAR
jgi:hypothetical protein